MRKTITVSLAAAALAVATLVGGVSSAGGESGPACADITAESHGPLNFYDSTAGRGVLTVDVRTRSGSACKQITYTLAISGVNNGPTVVMQKGSALFSSIEYFDTDNRVCISATASAGGGHLHDAAPDAGCLEIQSGVTGAPGGFH
jgi:hypothetical protein